MLEVCSESRRVALRRYEGAFAGRNVALEPVDGEEWDRKGFGEERLWVDFERDVLFVDAVSRARLYSKCAPLDPLGLLRRYALGEARKIRILALGAWFERGLRAGEVMIALRGHCGMRLREQVVGEPRGGRIDLNGFGGLTVSGSCWWMINSRESCILEDSRARRERRILLQGALKI